MIKHSTYFLRLMTVLLSAGIFVSSTFGQSGQTNTTPVPKKKTSSSRSTQLQTQPDSSKSSVTIVKTEPQSSTTNDSSAQKSSEKTVTNLSDSSSANKGTVLTTAPDSTVAKDTATTAVKPDTAAANNVTTSAVVTDSTATKDSTTASTRADSSNTYTSTSPDSASACDTMQAVQAAATDSAATLDSSTTSQSSTQTVQAEATVSDSSAVNQVASAGNKEKSKAAKEYTCTGMGLIFEGGTAGPQAGLIASLHQFMHCRLPINIRALFSYLPFKKEFKQTISEQDLGIDINARVSSADVLLDFHPFKNWFRLSAGAFFSFSKTKASMQAKEGKSIGLITITPEEMGSLEFTFSRRPVEPYVGMGIGNSLNRRVTFLMDVGAAYTGPIKVEGVGTGMIGPSADNARNLQTVFDKHNELFWWPVFSLGLGIKLF